CRSASSGCTSSGAPTTSTSTSTGASPRATSSRCSCCSSSWPGRCKLSCARSPRRRHNRTVAWKKSPPELVELFDRVRPEDPRAERRQMFGYPACFVNGNLFASLFEDHVILRLGDKHPAELAQLGGA